MFEKKASKGRVLMNTPSSFYSVRTLGDHGVLGQALFLIQIFTTIQLRGSQKLPRDCQKKYHAVVVLNARREDEGEHEDYRS